MFREGSQAWEAKDYIIELEQCEDVMLEQQTYLGNYMVSYFADFLSQRITTFSSLVIKNFLFINYQH